MKFSNFFSHIQEAPWYHEFLNPVVNQVDDHTKLLDIGTGSGKLLQMVSSTKEVNCIGVDTDAEMLKEAKINATGKYPFDTASFDVITICNVLFNLHQDTVNHVLTETLRLLKKGGKIVVLTPTGKGNLFTLSKSYFSIKNLSIYIWYYVTRNRAGPWTERKLLLKFSKKHSIKYRQKIILKGFAQIEILNN